MPDALDDRLTLLAADTTAERADFAAEVRRGLTARPKRLPCHLLYDERGSELFDAICDQPEYYLTRVERAILEERAAEIARAVPAGARLVELGSGTSGKTRVLIEALLREHGAPLSYQPVDVSGETLEAASRELLERYEGLEIKAFAGQYEEGVERLAEADEGPRLVLWLGSSIGNLDRREAAEFLGGLASGFTPADRLLVGIDLRKDRETLERAYDDAQGVTARFSLNLLERINRELGARFDPERFRHVATWNPAEGRIEIRLVARERVEVEIADLDLGVRFESGEEIQTERAYKYDLVEIEELAREAGLRVARQWLDGERRYSLTLFARAA